MFSIRYYFKQQKILIKCCIQKWSINYCRLSPSWVIEYEGGFSLAYFLPPSYIHTFHNNWQEESWPSFQKFLTMCYHIASRIQNLQLPEFRTSRPMYNSSIGTVNTGSSRAWASAITSLRKEENQLIAVMHQFQQKKWGRSKRNFASSKWVKGGTPH